MMKLTPFFNADEEIGNAPTAQPETSLTVSSAPIQTVVDMFTGRELQVFSSIDTTTAEGKIAAFNAMNDNAGNLTDHKGETFTITDVVAFPVEFLSDETGEVVQTIRVVLIDDQGAAWGTVAKGIASSVKNMIGTFGPAPWNPGIKVSPVEKKTRTGFKTVVLRLVN